MFPQQLRVARYIHRLHLSTQSLDKGFKNQESRSLVMVKQLVCMCVTIGQLADTCSSKCPPQRGSTAYRTLCQVPKVSTIEGFHCIQDTSPGPQGVHHRGVPLHTGHFTGSPRCPQKRGSTAYRTLHQVSKVSTIKGFHCIQGTLPGPQGLHHRGVALYAQIYRYSCNTHFIKMNLYTIYQLYRTPSLCNITLCKYSDLEKVCVN